MMPLPVCCVFLLTLILINIKFKAIAIKNGNAGLLIK
jgi:hypothetical protein